MASEGTTYPGLNDDNAIEDLILSDRSLSSDDLLKIITTFVRPGCRNEKAIIDFKRMFEDSPKSWFELLRDIVAANNFGGGLFIFGVDNYGNINGCDIKTGKLFDPSIMQDKLKRFAHSAKIPIECTETEIEGRKIYGLKVRPTPYPVIFDKNGQSTEKGKTQVIFQEGVVYVRDQSQSRPATQTELNRILENAVSNRIKDLLARIEKVAYAPQGSTIQIVSPGESDRRISVRIDPEDPNALPVRHILDDEPFVDVIQEAIAQLKTWKSDDEHRVDRKLLAKWFFHSYSSDWTEELSIFCLLSALSSRGFTHCWATRVPKDKLYEIIVKEIDRDKYPAILYIPYLVPSFFWEEKDDLSSMINDKTNLLSVRNVVRKLAQFNDNMDYRSRCKINNV